MLTHLISKENPSGLKLEDILIGIRRDIIFRCTKIVDDTRPEARHVLDNNTRILILLGEAIGLAEESTSILDKAFGPSLSGGGGKPRIGVE